MPGGSVEELFKGENIGGFGYYSSQDPWLNWFHGSSVGQYALNWPAGITVDANGAMTIADGATVTIRLKENLPRRSVSWRPWRPGTYLLKWTGTVEADVHITVRTPTWMTQEVINTNRYEFVIPDDADQYGNSGNNLEVVISNSSGSSKTFSLPVFTATEWEESVEPSNPAGLLFSPEWKAKFPSNTYHIRPIHMNESLWGQFGAIDYQDPTEYLYSESGNSFTNYLLRGGSYGAQARLATELDVEFLWLNLSPGLSEAGFAEVAAEVAACGWTGKINPEVGDEAWNPAVPYFYTRTKSLATVGGNVANLSVCDRNGVVAPTASVTNGVNTITLSETAYSTGAEVWFGEQVFVGGGEGYNGQPNRTCFLRKLTDTTASLHPTSDDATNNTNVITPNATAAAVTVAGPAIDGAGNAAVAEKFWQAYDAFVAEFGAESIQPIISAQAANYHNLASVFAYQRGGTGPRFGTILRHGIGWYVHGPTMDEAFEHAAWDWTPEQWSTLMTTGITPDLTDLSDHAGLPTLEDYFDAYIPQMAEQPWNETFGLNGYEGWHHYAAYLFQLPSQGLCTGAISTSVMTSDADLTGILATGDEIYIKQYDAIELYECSYPTQCAFVRVLTTTTFSLHETPEDAVANTGLVVLKNNVTGIGFANCTHYLGLMESFITFIQSAYGIAWGQTLWDYVKTKMPGLKTCFEPVSDLQSPERNWGFQDLHETTHHADSPLQTWWKGLN